MAVWQFDCVISGSSNSRNGDLKVQSGLSWKENVNMEALSHPGCVLEFIRVDGENVVA